MITLNKLAIRCRYVALRKGIITKDSSHKGLSKSISVEWRRLWDANKSQSDSLAQYSKREEAAADIIISALTYLQSIGCEDIERLIKDKIEYNEERTD